MNFKSVLISVLLTTFMVAACGEAHSQAQPATAATCSESARRLSGDNQNITVAGHCNTLNISGNNNTVQIDSVGNLSLMGNGNSVKAAKVGDIKAGGDRNTVSYTGREPAHWFGGDGNTLRKGTAPNISPSAPARVTSNAKTAPPKRAQPKPVERNKVDAIYYIGQLNNFDILVLLKDGTARWNPSRSIERLDVKSDKAKQSKRWRQWRRAGGKIQLRPLSGGGEWTALKNRPRKKIIPRKRGFRLASGKWKHASSQSYGTYGGSAFFADYVFSNNGRYEASSSKIMGYSTPGVSSSAASSSCNASGQRSASSSSAKGGSAGSSRTGTGCGAANIGKYFISGYSIEFHAENGDVYIKPFYEIDRAKVIIGNRWFAAGLK